MNIVKYLKNLVLLMLEVQLEMRSSKRKRIQKDFGPNFQTYNIERDLITIFETLSSSDSDFGR